MNPAETYQLLALAIPLLIANYYWSKLVYNILESDGEADTRRLNGDDTVTGWRAYAWAIFLSGTIVLWTPYAYFNAINGRPWPAYMLAALGGISVFEYFAAWDDGLKPGQIIDVVVRNKSEPVAKRKNNISR